MYALDSWSFSLHFSSCQIATTYKAASLKFGHLLEVKHPLFSEQTGLTGVVKRLCSLVFVLSFCAFNHVYKIYVIKFNYVLNVNSNGFHALFLTAN